MSASASSAPIHETTPPAGSPSPAGQPVAVLRREPDSGLVAGVCAGLGRRLGIDPLVLRIGFVATALAGAVGLVLYAVAWALIPAEPASEAAARGVAMRAHDRGKSWETATGVGLLALSALLLLRELGVWSSDALVWPVVIAAAGAALIWRQSAHTVEQGVPGRGSGAQSTAPRGSPDRVEASARRALLADLPSLGTAAVARVGVGVALVAGGGFLFLEGNDALGSLPDVVLAAVVAVVGLALVLAPWWWRLAKNLAAERAERVRSEERAEMAAHLHDSVLQTLALMQRRADDPREVATLARRQERELRAWLSRRPEALPAEMFAAALEAAAAEVERDHGVAVDVVAVGDCPLEERTEALLAAAREALVNAAKFAGGGPISLYAEVTGERLHVFVRDRGPGFDPAAVPSDRRGLRESIVGRMERHGGRALFHASADGRVAHAGGGEGVAATAGTEGVETTSSGPEGEGVKPTSSGPEGGGTEVETDGVKTTSSGAEGGGTEVELVMERRGA